MEIPGLGKVTKGSFGAYVSNPIPVPIFGGNKCRIGIEGYDDDKEKRDFHIAIENFLGATPAVLHAAERDLFKYYENCKEDLEDGQPAIKSPHDVWKHVHFGSEPCFSRRDDGDKKVYVSIECGCDWEEEHGLQIVLKDDNKVNKLGPFDSHLTNSDAYDDERFENVIYVAREQL